MSGNFINRFKAAIDAGKTLQGGWSLSGSPTVIEAMGYSGADYLVIDLEHSPTWIHGMLPLLQAADASGIMPVIRMSDHNPTSIKHALDLGANSLLFPFVETAEEAAKLVAACFYPPHGFRGFSRMNRSSRYLADTAYPTRAKDDVFIVAQIESVEAVERLEAIAKVPGIGGIFIGPGDLSASFGVLGQTGHQLVRDAMADCGRRAKAIGVPIGTVVGDVEQAVWCFEQGYTFVAVSNDMAMMVTNGQRMQRELRAARQA